MAPSSPHIEYGIIKFWNSNKGFGFAVIDYLGDVFIHISKARATPTEQSFGNGALTCTPQVGDRVQAINVMGDRGMRASVWGFSTHPVRVPLPQARKKIHHQNKAAVREVGTGLDAWMTEYLMGGRQLRRDSHEVRTFHESDAMKQRVRIELEQQPARLFTEPNWKPCRCLIVPEKVDQMQEKDEDCERIPHAEVESTFFIYRVVRHDCPVHINATPMSYIAFRDCGEYPLDNERVSYVGMCDDRTAFWPRLVEDPWYRLLAEHGYCDPRDYLLD